eukprot:CAMPEP_0185449856 /NCGR_PEP_ID=MMETSP1365-20130426/61685_1 /TAXON_ID=38817 /ORGANISM="Gephyrocapsa oceanica, Strain RCC1303" /LENGTH=39 /DNA_ID= /DNA_START= /DNA_END= /DNA_ORIENTATION=
MPSKDAGDDDARQRPQRHVALQALQAGRREQHRRVRALY